MTERVLITGARAPAALDLARCFAAAGFEVHMADCAPIRMAAFSRAVARVHAYPSPRRAFAHFAAAIAGLVERLQPVAIVPTCEEVFYLAALGEAAERVIAPPADVLRRLHSKFAFAQEAAALGLATPRTVRVDSAATLAAAAADTRALVFKREFSRFGTQTLVGPTREAALALRPTPAAPWVVQQRVRGEEVSLYAVSAAARLKAFSAYRSPWKFDGGAGYAFEALEAPLHDRLLDVARTLAGRLIPRGQFACDVIVDAEGTPWLLECNPRATSGVHLFERRADLALAILGRGGDEPVLARSATPTHVGPALDSFGLMAALRRRRLREWRERRKISIDVISAPRDRAPVAGALIDTLHLGVNALLRGKSLTEMSTDDIEWNGDAV